MNQLGELQKHISEISKLNSELIAIASSGNKDDVEMTKSSRGITFTLIPTPNKKIVEDFGLKYDSFSAAYATFIIDREGRIRFDREGRIRFKSVDTSWNRTSVSKIIKELQGIQ
jgi:peroxiredoxin